MYFFETKSFFFFCNMLYLVFSKLNSNLTNVNKITTIYSDIRELSALTINQKQHRKIHLLRDILHLYNGIYSALHHQDMCNKIYL